MGAAVFLSTGFFYRMAYPQKFRAEVERAAADTGLSPELIYGVIHTESGFRPDVVSSAGARGLMQITEDAYDWAKMSLGGDGTCYDDLFAPSENIRYGAVILSLLLKRFDDLEVALCAYHAGAANVASWLGNPDYSPDGRTLSRIPYRNTHWYVDKVLSVKKQYEKLYN